MVSRVGGYTDREILVKTEGFWTLVVFGRIWTYFVAFCRILLYFVVFGRILSYLVVFGLLGSNFGIWGPLHEVPPDGHLAKVSSSFLLFRVGGYTGMTDQHKN